MLVRHASVQLELGSELAVNTTFNMVGGSAEAGVWSVARSE